MIRFLPITTIMMNLITICNKDMEKMFMHWMDSMRKAKNIKDFDDINKQIIFYVTIKK